MPYNPLWTEHCWYLLKTKMIGEFQWLVTPIEEYLPTTTFNSVDARQRYNSPIIKRNPKRNPSVSPKSMTVEKRTRTVTGGQI